MTFEAIMQVEKSKIEVMRKNNQELKNNDKIDRRNYNYNRTVLNGIEAVKRLKGC